MAALEHDFLFSAGGHPHVLDSDAVFTEIGSPLTIVSRASWIPSAKSGQNLCLPNPDITGPTEATPHRLLYI